MLEDFGWSWGVKKQAIRSNFRREAQEAPQEASRDGFGRVLGRFWEGFGRVLEGFWESFGKVLDGFWEDFGKKGRP